MEIVRLHPLSQADLADRIAAGGYLAALARSTQRRRTAWYRDYVETLVQRDVRELARIAALDALPRLLALAAGQTAHLLNVSDLASPFKLSRRRAWFDEALAKDALSEHHWGWA
jgi:predicted AAA+ superfamily ATPase